MSRNQSSKAWEELFNSLKEKGCSFEGLYFDGEDSNKCLYTAKDVKAGDVLATIERQAIIDSDDLMPENYNYDLSGLTTQMKATLRLIEEASKQGTEHRAYIDSLKYCGPLPWFTMDNTDDPFLERLGMTTWIEKLQAMTQTIRDVVDSAKPELKLDSTLVNWAFSKVLSRSFSSTAGHCVLAPLCDLMNHDVNNNVKIVDETEDHNAFQIVAERDISADEELIISYGKIDNMWLFLFYGFTLPGNPSPTANLSLDMSELGKKADNLFAIGDFSGGQGYPVRLSFSQVLDLVPEAPEANTPIEKEVFKLMVMFKLAEENFRQHVGLSPEDYQGAFASDIQKIAANHSQTLKYFAIFCRLCGETLTTGKLVNGIDDERFAFLSTSYMERLNSLLEASQDAKTG